MSLTTYDDVVLVDQHDVAVGRCSKLDAHQQPGVRHRAFSVVIFDERDRILLQRRAATKYHFGGRWSNSCCGHPRPDEQLLVAATRRLREEMGFVVPLVAARTFEYRAEDHLSGLVEHEIDHIVHGHAVDVVVHPSADEVGAWAWVDRATLATWLEERPEEFTPWFSSVVQGIWDIAP